VNLSTRAWNDLIKPAGQAALLGGVVFGLGWTISGAPEGGAMWGLSGAALVLARKFLLDEALEARKPQPTDPEKTRQPWEVTTHVTVRHTDPHGYGPVWWYDMPVAEAKLKRAGFHLAYLDGRFSHNYLTDPHLKPKIFTKPEFEKLEYYLIQSHAAKWKGGSKNAGIELLEDGREMLNYFSRYYYPLPHEKKRLAMVARSGGRTYHT
jgi:hypothetical protein